MDGEREGGLIKLGRDSKSAGTHSRRELEADEAAWVE